ncbi:WD40 repeat-like protein [Astrocystis sublimbata]|nr:WD40 repeat-like protein [Astrocystis sublimbata]
MSAPRQDSFQKALRGFKQTLPPNLINEFSVATLDDVRGICQDIQHEHGQQGTLRHMRRLSAFIEGMEQLGKVIEVYTNTSEIVCFIWGPIKFLLGIARNHIEAFDKLLDVYGRIGHALPGLSRYQAVFEKYSPLCTVLEDYYSDILSFHRAALSVFRRSHLLHSTWKTFNSEFGPILQSMEKRRELLESEKGSATLAEIQNLRRDISDLHSRQKDQAAREVAEKHKRELYDMREKLQAPDYAFDQETATEIRQGHSSGSWIFKDPTFCYWYDDTNLENGVLYVNGMPGAGKTILMSAVIEKLINDRVLSNKKQGIAYFYFKQTEPNKVSHNNLLRALLLQLAEQDSTISDHLLGITSGIDAINLRSSQKLEGLVKTALESFSRSYIVLDGLDECAPEEAKKVLNWFLSLTDNGRTGAKTMLRVLFCGQRDGTLDKLLSDQPSISLEVPEHTEDINQYCRNLGAKIRMKFQITPEIEDKIVAKVSTESQGMFLYARVVLHNLLSQTRRSCLTKEMEPGTFPRRIEKAYERVAVRIFQMTSEVECEDARKIMGWIVCARRLLRWREIQSMFCIDPIKGDVDYKERRLVVTCKELCGSLIDMHQVDKNKASPEDIVNIVHETAQQFLVRNNWLNASLEHAKLAIFCSSYLTSEPFAPRINEEQITVHATQGYYALQDYAVQYWFDHFMECTGKDAILDSDQVLKVTNSFQSFLQSYGLPSKLNGLNSEENQEETNSINGLPKDRHERNQCLNIEHRTIMIRQAMETLRQQVLDVETQEVMADLYGTTAAAYKCTKPWCEHFTFGFERSEDRQQHINRHDRPFRCAVESCFAFRLGYDKLAKLDQHKRDHHSESGIGEAVFPKSNKRIHDLVKALQMGDISTIRAWGDFDDQWHRTRKRKDPPLYLATKANQFETCAFLLTIGVDVNTRAPSHGRTALHAAVSARNLDIVHLFIYHKGCNPDPMDNFKRTPFLEACALGYLDIVKLLHDTGKIKSMQLYPARHPPCDDQDNVFSMTVPLGYACRKGHTDTSKNPRLLRSLYSDSHDDVAKLLRPMIIQHEKYVVRSDFISENENFKFDTLASKNDVVEMKISKVYTQDATCPASCIEFNPDGSRVAVVYNRGILIYDEHLRSKEPYFISLSESIHVLRFSWDSKYLACIWGRTVEIWDFAEQNIIKSLALEDERGISLTFHGSGDRPTLGTLVTIGNKGTIELWNMNNWTRLAHQSIADAHKYYISGKRDYVYVGMGDDTIQRRWFHYSESWKTDILDSNGSYIVSRPSGFFRSRLDNSVKKWEYLPVGEAQMAEKTSNKAVTSYPQWLLSGSKDGTINIRDCVTDELRFQIRGIDGEVTHVVASPAGNCFATWSTDSKLRVWHYTLESVE